MPPGVAVCFSSLFIRLVCMAFLTSSDKALWHLALPMIFSNITVPLLGLVDTAVIGHLDSPVYLGGVAVGATATSFLFMLLLFLRMSTTGLTAQAYGAKNPQALARALVQPLLLALGAGALIALLRTPIIDLALHIVGGSEAVLEQARRFLEIRWLSAPASLATVIAEYATLLIGLLMVRKILKLRGISGEMLKTAWRGNFRRLLALNRDIMLRSLLLQLCFGAITVLGARLGSDIVAVNAVLMTLLTFTAYALDGFAYAVEAHSGQAYGARDGSQLLDVWRAACRQSGIVALLFSVVYLLAGEHIIALLTSLTQIQQLADRYLIWQVILPLVGVWCYLLDGMFIGATRAAEMRNSMAVAAAGFALTLLTLPWLGNHGLWLALTVFLALRGLSLAAIWRRHWRNGTWFAAT
ncbi:MATE family efflux transporter DinF [Escherichia coli]|nr:MATE family efflux transporter DinF [Escherichia coli]EFK9281395.1 MATE family efflux transporter DinF [Escherichia coli]EFL0904715.1 MATE family efflux transporter DinF [Escherichia coli]EGY9779726.1 MATE family efflux transporter DinF [Escherichia coli]